MNEIGSMERNLTEQELVLTYQLLLGRTPSAGEIARMMENGPQLNRLRRVFLSSPEFSGNLTRFLSSHDVSIRPRIEPARAGRYVHLHIPKTAGTTMSAVLRSAMGPGRSVSVSENGHGPLGGRDPVELNTYRFVFGHLSYKAMSYFPPDTLAICVLRRPGDRLLSFYNYILRTCDHPLHETLTETGLSFGEFLEFVDGFPSHRRDNNNAQMRIVSGLTEVAYLGREREVFEKAISHILTGRVIFGLTERLGAFQSYLKSIGILREVSAARLNSSEQPAVLEHALDALTATQHEIYARYVAWDDVLYSVCEKLAEDREAGLIATE